MKWTYLCLCLCLFMGEIECGGQIWLKLVSFQNRRSLDAAGFLCDHHWGVKTSDCDHKFIICVDNINGYESTNVCSYGRWSTDIIRNADYITFGKDIRLYSNPKTFSFHKWTGSCKLKIDVYDHDTLEDDYVDSMTGHYIMERPYYNETNAKPKTLKLSNRVSMTVNMTVYCDPNYYGRGCDIYCVPSSKYTCNRITGAKRCTSGWTGTYCHIKKNVCVSAPCKNKATCYSTRETYRCVCNDGFTGRQCEKEINECASFPCKNNGTCVDLINNYKCTCPYGYSGEDCDSLTDLCKKTHCLNNSTCVMDSNDVKFHCECGKGWSGHLCGTDVNECESNICQHKSTCENTIGGFRCQCTDGWTGNVCNVNIDECKTGYTGKLCHEEIDECSGNPCLHNGSCFDLDGAFTCHCTEGYSGNVCDLDIDECNISPCLNDGICVNTNGSFYCQCSGSWNGIYCQSDVNECENDVCKNGGECRNFDGRFDCECKMGYTGKLCHKEIDECSGNPCLHNGSCFDLNGAFTCQCTEGYKGNVCDLDINECHSDPCRNGGMCVNTYGSFYCQCPETSNGTLCQFDVNECDNKICKNGRECKNNDGEFSCTCPEGFSGAICEDINECFQDPCANGSTCLNVIGSFLCQCLYGFTGKDCSKNINECSPQPCHRNATCIDEIGQFKCLCPQYYVGPICADKIEPCQNISCSYNGICISSSNNSFLCNCHFGFKGIHCEQEILPFQTEDSGIVCNGVNDNFVIYLDQNVTSAVRKKIVSKIKWLIHKYTGYDVDSLNIDESADLLETNKGDMISNVSLSLSINGTKVCGENLEKLIRLIKKNESEFPFNIFNGSIYDFTQPEDIAEREKILKKAWLEDKWYLIMIAVGLVVLIAIVLFVLFRYNRKKQRHSSIKIVYMNSSFQRQQCYEDTTITSR